MVSYNSKIFIFYKKTRRQVTSTTRKLCSRLKTCKSRIWHNPCKNPKKTDRCRASTTTPRNANSWMFYRKAEGSTRGFARCTETTNLCGLAGLRAWNQSWRRRVSCRRNLVLWQRKLKQLGSLRKRRMKYKLRLRRKNNLMELIKKLRKLSEQKKI